MSWLDKVQKLQKNENSQYFANFGSDYQIEKVTIEKKLYYPIKKVLFEKIECNVPNETDKILTKIYGKDYMQLPPLEKRVTHNPIEIRFE